jgi:hypothetical protein
VLTERINSPSRHNPGDVSVLADLETEQIEKAFEVKDKPVGITEVQIFCRKCVELGTVDAAYVMVASGQRDLGDESLIGWAEQAGLSLAIFREWRDLVRQCLFWAPNASPKAALEAAALIRERLIGIEAEPASVQRWDTLVRGQDKA